MNYKEYLVDASIKILEAMRKLDELDKKIVFVNDGDLFIGTLTDGDIRRFLLAGGNMDDCIKNAANKKPLFAKNLIGAKKLYDEKNYIAIPIVKEGKIISIYFGDDEEDIVRYNLNIPVVINAGGKGTRLYPYTKVLPKPLIPIGDTPILEHIIQNFIKYGCTKIDVIVNYKKELIKAFFNSNDDNYDITWFDEEKPLGTGGGLSLLRGKLNETFFFTSCDTLILSNLDSILRYHRKQKNVVTMICAYKNVKIPYGIIDMGENGKINEMKEKPEFSYLTNTGMYIVEPEVLDDIKDDESIGFPDVIKRQIEMGKNVSVYPISENEWLDMGELPELEKMRNKLYGE